MAGPRKVVMIQRPVLPPVETVMVMMAEPVPIAISVSGITAIPAHANAQVDIGLNINGIHSAIAILRALGHPLADWLAVAVVTRNLVNGDDGGAEGGVANDACLALEFGLGVGGSCETKNSGCSKK